MSLRTVSSRLFNQDPTSVKCAATKESVQITDHGKVSHVLLSIEKYQELPIPKKVDLDVEYLQRRSFFFDINILWLTFVIPKGHKFH